MECTLRENIKTIVCSRSGINCFTTYLGATFFKLQAALLFLERGGNVDGVERIHLQSPTTHTSQTLLLKVKSPSESWQPLVGISISAAVEADYMGVVPHTGSDINLLQREGLL